MGEPRAGTRELKRAFAKILDASPTADTVGSGEEKRRIWALRVRVEPEDGPPFEAEARRELPLASEVEERISRGEFITAVPADSERLKVVYDPSDREQVTVLPGGGGSEKPLAFKAMIVGKAIGP